MTNQFKSYAHFLVLLACFLALQVQAQSVSGVIVDEREQPIPFATVQLGEKYGVISNAEGNFTLVIPEEPQADSVAISNLGFETLVIPLELFSSRTYVLTEKITELDEVLVSNKQLTPEEVVQKMLEAAPELHAENDFSRVFFMRNQENQKLLDFSFEIDKASETSRADLRELNAEVGVLTKSLKGRRFQFFTEYYGDHLRVGDSSKVRIDRGVILKEPASDISSEEITKKLINTVRPYLESEATYKVKTGLIKVEDSLKTDEIFDEDLDSTRGKTKYVKGMLNWRLKEYAEFYNNDDLDFLQKMNRYEYRMAGFSNIEGESVYVIEFEPKRSSAVFRGKLYINVFDHGLMRMEYEMLEDENLHNVNLKFLLGVKFREDRVRVTSSYRRKADGKYYLKFGRKSSGMYAYISRPLKFIKNRASRSDSRQVLKIDFMFELDNLSTSEIYIVEDRPVASDALQVFGDQEKFTPIEIERYDPGVWEGYNIIAPIEEIRVYGKEKLQ